MKYFPLLVVAAVSLLLSIPAMALPPKVIIKSMSRPGLDGSGMITLDINEQRHTVTDPHGLVALVIAQTALFQKEAALLRKDRQRTGPFEETPGDWTQLKAIYMDALDRVLISYGGIDKVKLGALRNRIVTKNEFTYSAHTLIGGFIKTAAEVYELAGKKFFADGPADAPGNVITSFGYYFGDAMSDSSGPIQGDWAALTREYFGDPDSRDAESAGCPTNVALSAPAGPEDDTREVSPSFKP